MEGVFSGSVAALSDVRGQFRGGFIIRHLDDAHRCRWEVIQQIESSIRPNSVMLFQFYYNAEIVSSADIDDFM